MFQSCRSAAMDIALVTFVSSLIFFLNLGKPPLWDRDEPRNAGCAAEMAARGDWVVPVFNQELRTHKPGLLYWLMMASYACFGINEFGARFASALLGVGTVLLTYATGRRLFSAAVGRWAAIVLASTIMFGVAARAATPDSLLIFCGTLAVTLFVYATFPARACNADDAEAALFPTSTCWVVGMYSAMGLGVLAKGPVGFVFPTAVIGMYLLIVRLDWTDTTRSWRKRLLRMARLLSPSHFLHTCWLMRPVTAIVSVLMVALPWYLWVGLRTDGVWVREFLLTHNLQRATQTMEGHGGPPILFYAASILVGFFPWSVLTIPAGRNALAALQPSDARSYRATVLLLCWVGVYVGIFSLANTKLPSYVTPCYPALAILAATFLHQWRTVGKFSRLWLNVGLGHLIVVGAGVAVALPITSAYLLPGIEWLGLLGAIPLAGGVVCAGLQRRKRYRSATTVMAYTAVGFCVFLMAVVPTEIGSLRRYDTLFRRTSDHQGPIAAFGHLEPSWVFYSGRRIHEFHVSQTEALAEFLSQFPNTLIITTPQRIEESGGSQGVFANCRVILETQYFLRNRRLLLVGAGSSEPAEIASHSGSLPVHDDATY